MFFFSNLDLSENDYFDIIWRKVIPIYSFLLQSKIFLMYILLGGNFLTFGAGCLCQAIFSDPK